MEKEELREILAQQLATYRKNSPVRAVLVMSPGDHFVPKLIPELFEKVNFIPFRDNFRIVLGQLNENEYAAFKKQYYDRLLFFLAPISSFLDLPEKLIDHGLVLSSFISRGSGRITMRGMNRGIVSETFNSFRKRGFMPTSLEFEGTQCNLNLKRDCSVRVRGDPVSLARDISKIYEVLLDSSWKLMEKLAGMRLVAGSSSHMENFVLHRAQSSQDLFLEKVAEEYSLIRTVNEPGFMQYLVSGTRANGFVPLIKGVHIRMIPDSLFSPEIATRLIEISESMEV